MISRAEGPLLGLAALAIALAGCSTQTITPGEVSTAPASTPAASSSASHQADLTRPGAARTAVDALVRSSEGLPVIKVDLTATSATLSALKEGKVVAWRWDAGVVTPVESDIEYIKQATFNPADYQLGNLAAIFAKAERISASDSNQELQIVEYDQGRVLMTVTTRPESMPVFFRPDGSPINRLDFGTAAGFTEAIGDTAGKERVLAMGWSESGGFWADTADPDEDGVVRLVTRQARVPSWESSRKAGADADAPTFPPAQVDPAVLARLVAELPQRLGKPGAVPSFEISRRHQMALPVITFDVDGTSVVTTLGGTDITATVGG